METEPYQLVAIIENLGIVFYSLSIDIIFQIFIVFVLLAGSAFVSGSEVAYFSLSPTDIKKLQTKKSKRAYKVLGLISFPEKLLATILISNNLINIAIVILATFITNSLIDFTNAPVFGFLFKVVFITFILLLFGEILPKIYATYYTTRFCMFMAYPLYYLSGFFKPVSFVLMKFTTYFQTKLSPKQQNLSMNELSHALELTSGSLTDEKDILKGIVKFGNINVSEIMKSRLDVVSLDINTSFKDIIPLIIESGYSRIPVFEDSLDSIKGILYVKDLLPHIHKKDGFKWQTLLRPPYYVPETKKINILLKEFQANKIHMAIVIDEYGGTSGIITLEDILEEIVGEIIDESDEEDEIVFTKLDDNTYVFEGKILLNDFYKITDTDDHTFDGIKGDADTLAGLILELKGDFPKQNDKIICKNFTFIIDSVDKRRIKKIKVIIHNSLQTVESEGN